MTGRDMPDAVLAGIAADIELELERFERERDRELLRREAEERAEEARHGDP